MAKYKIRKDDTVMVIAGGNRGRTGRVLKVLPDSGHVVVERVNVVRRNVKPQGDRPGGVVEKESPIAISNVALWDVAGERTVKIGLRVNEDGSKVRFDKSNGQNLD